MAQTSGDGGFPALASNASQLPYAVSHRGWGLANQIFVCGLIGVFALVMLGLEIFRPDARGANPVIAVVALAALAACGYRLWQLRSPWLVLYPDRLEKRGLMGWRTFSRADMLGYRTVSDRSGSWLVISPKIEQPGQGSVRIPQSVREDPVADRWLTGLRDLAAEAFAAAKAEFLADPRFGADAPQREARLSQAKKVALVFNIACVVIGVALFIWPPAYLVTLAVVVGAVAAATLLTRLSGGLLVWADRTGVRPPLIGAFAPAVAMSILGFSRFHTLNINAMLVMAAVLTLALFALVYFRAYAPAAGGPLRLDGAAAAPTARRPNLFAALIAFGFAAGFLFYGAGAFVNAALDTSKVQVYPLTVQGKHYTSGKSTTYYINVGPWSDQQAGDVSIPSSLYDDLSIGSTVCFFRQSGALDIAWFRTDQCPAGTPAPPAQTDSQSADSATGSAEISNKSNPN